LWAQPVDLRALVGSVMDTFRALTIASHVPVRVLFDPAVPQLALLDATHVHQILTNLIGARAPTQAPLTKRN
jgi:signal transduction histidine kinase